MVYFNSRPSARGDLSSAVDKSRRNHFNSRPSARGDYKTQIIESSNGKFQFTPLREGRPKGGEYYGQRRTFQFTPLREGRPLAKFRILCYTISIHAPPRGATVLRRGQLIWLGDFNSRPSARGDADFGRGLVDTYHFNSRPSARGDSQRQATPPWG